MKESTITIALYTILAIIVASLVLGYMVDDITTTEKSINQERVKFQNY